MSIYSNQPFSSFVTRSLFSTFTLTLLSIALFILLSFSPNVAAARTDRLNLPSIKPMKGMELTSISAETIINGLPISSQEYTSNETIERITSHYLKEWKKAGFEPPFSEIKSDSFALHTKGGDYLYTINGILFSEKPYVRGSLMVSIAPELAKVEMETRFPMMQGGSVVSKMVNQDGDREEEHLLLKTGRGFEESVAFLTERLKKEGWQLDFSELPQIVSASNARMFTGQRGDEILSITMVRDDSSMPRGGQKADTTIIVHWIR